jgi:phosphinothricin acetyltransferase
MGVDGEPRRPKGAIVEALVTSDGRMIGAATAVRAATRDDAAAIARIHNQAVATGAGSRETREQSEAERRAWLEGLVAKGYPVLVATWGGEVVGFGAVTPFHPASGYARTASGSLYVEASARGAGVGKALGRELLAAARARNVHTIIAGIDAENVASIRLHESHGFERVGHFREIAWRDGRWRDDVCMQLILG